MKPSSPSTKCAGGSRFVSSMPLFGAKNSQSALPCHRCLEKVTETPWSWDSVYPSEHIFPSHNRLFSKKEREKPRTFQSAKPRISLYACAVPVKHDPVPKHGWRETELQEQKLVYLQAGRRIHQAADRNAICLSLSKHWSLSGAFRIPHTARSAARREQWLAQTCDWKADSSCGGDRVVEVVNNFGYLARARAHTQNTEQTSVSVPSASSGGRK